MKLSKLIESISDTLSESTIEQLAKKLGSEVDDDSIYIEVPHDDGYADEKAFEKILNKLKVNNKNALNNLLNGKVIKLAGGLTLSVEQDRGSHTIIIS